MKGLLSGFADPVSDAQSTFRAVLEAMSRPGRVLRLSNPPSPPEPLCPAAGAVLLTLADAETPLWLDAGLTAAEWAVFHCGCPLASAPGRAAFVLATATPPALDTLEPGTDEEPERAATLILQVTSLEEGEGREGAGWRLTGPGIEGEHRLHAGGTPPGFLAAWGTNRARFPMGVDVVLCAGNRIAALPRGVAIERG